MAPIFPAPPWRLSLKYTATRYVFGVLFFLGGLALAVVCARLTADSERRLREEQAVWDAADSVEVRAVVDGTQQTQAFVAHSYDLTVSFQPYDGALQTEKLAFSTVGGGLDDEALTFVRYLRYDPRDPHRFALDVAVGHASARRAHHFLLLGGGGVLLVGLLLVLGVRLVQSARAAATVVQNGEEIACAYLFSEPELVNGKKTHNTIYRFRFPDTHGGEVKHAVFKSNAGGPLFLGPENRVILVLVNRRKRTQFVVPRSDLYPFVFDAKERDEVRARAAIANELPEGNPYRG